MKKSFLALIFCLSFVAKGYSLYATSSNNCSELWNLLIKEETPNPSENISDPPVKGNLIDSKEPVHEQTNVLDFIKRFERTWFFLDAYDKQSLSESSENKITVDYTLEEIETISTELMTGVKALKNYLMAQSKASDLFAEEKQVGTFEGIIASVFQSVFGQKLYPTLEEMAAHLFYFIIKDHPFHDGNKRTGAFLFMWFLHKSNLFDASSVSPEELSFLTLLVAESASKEGKQAIVDLILSFLETKKPAS